MNKKNCRVNRGKLDNFNGKTIKIMTKVNV